MENGVKANVTPCELLILSLVSSAVNNFLLNYSHNILSVLSHMFQFIAFFPSQHKIKEKLVPIIDESVSICSYE